MLENGEKVIADTGYKCADCMFPNNVRHTDRMVLERLRAQYESCNERIKSFSILKSTFWHSAQCHTVVINAVNKLVALKIRLEELLFTI